MDSIRSADNTTAVRADTRQLQQVNTLGLPSQARVIRLSEASQAPLLGELAARGESLFVLGGGSNVVLREHPRHLVAQVALRGIELLREGPDGWLVEAAAGEPWHAFVDHCLRRGWPGLENLALIPGTVGAAPVQNIGAYGLELAQRLDKVVAWDIPGGQRVELEPDDCGFAYRDSRFKQAGAGRWLILAVRFRLPRQWQPILDYPDLRAHPALRDVAPSPRAIFDAVCEIRRRKLPDPAVLGNAGSFFKNPIVPRAQAEALRRVHPDLPLYPQPGDGAKLAAGWLIEQAGWKGRRLGPVGMHERQALVLVNHGGAVADDVLRLAQAVRDGVRARFGVLLEQEPVILD